MEKTGKEVSWLKEPGSSLIDGLMACGLISSNSIVIRSQQNESNLNLEQNGNELLRPKTTPSKKRPATAVRSVRPQTPAAAEKPRVKARSATQTPMTRSVNMTTPKKQPLNSFAVSPNQDSLSTTPAGTQRDLKLPKITGIVSTERKYAGRKEAMKLINDYHAMLASLNLDDYQEPEQLSQNLAKAIEYTLFTFNKAIVDVRGFSEEHARLLNEVKLFYHKRIEQITEMSEYYTNAINSDKEELNKSRNEKFHLMEDIRERDATIQELQNNLDESVKRNEILNCTIQTSSDKLDEALIAKDSLESELNSVMFRLSKSEEARNQAQQQAEATQEMLNSCRATIATQEVELTKYRTEGAGFRPLYLKASEDISHLKEEIEELNKQMENMIEKQETVDEETQTDALTSHKGNKEEISTKSGSRKSRVRTQTTKRSPSQAIEGVPSEGTKSPAEHKTRLSAESSTAQLPERPKKTNREFSGPIVPSSISFSVTASGDGNPHDHLNPQQMNISALINSNKTSSVEIMDVRPPIPTRITNKIHKDNIQQAASDKDLPSATDNHQEKKVENTEDKPENEEQPQQETEDIPKPEDIYEAKETPVNEDNHVVANLNKPSEAVQKLPTDYKINHEHLVAGPTLMNAIYRLLPLKLNSMLMTSPSHYMESVLSQQKAQAKPYNWVLQHVLDFFLSFSKSDQLDNVDIDPVTLFKHELFEKYKLQALSNKIFSDIVQTAQYYKVGSNCVSFFLQFLLQEFTIVDFKFFNVLFNLGTDFIYPSVGEVVNNPDLVPEQPQFLIHIDICQYFVSTLFNHNKSLDFEKMRVETKYSPHPDLVDFFSFATQMLMIFRTVHQQFHIQVRNLLTLVGWAQSVEISQPLFADFFIIVNPFIEDTEINKFWQRFKVEIQMSSKHSKVINQSSFIHFCSDFPDISNSILSLPNVQSFDRAFYSLPPPLQVFLTFIKKRFTSYIRKVQMILPETLRDITKPIVIKIRNSLIRCDVQTSLTFYRHFLQIVDLKLTEKTPYVTFAPNVSLETIEQLIKMMKEREELAADLLSDEIDLAKLNQENTKYEVISIQQKSENSTPEQTPPVSSTTSQNIPPINNQDANSNNNSE